MTIAPVTEKTYDAVINLLTEANLPVKDINEHTALFEPKNGNETLGAIGPEHDGQVGLLRSLSVEESERGKGYGEELVCFLENAAKEKGIKTLYLLTTTAASFFSKRGYKVISRAEVPSFIQQTSEFTSTCPSSATVMKKELL